MTRLEFGILAITLLRTLSAQSPADVLEKARDKILSSVRSLPKYTCLETIERGYYVAPRGRESRHMMTEAPANSCAADFRRRGPLDAKDRLRLEVAHSGESEIHAWPGASRFDTRSIDKIVPFGPTSTGAFGGYLIGVFENPGAELKFLGQKTFGRREVFEYSYAVPLKASHFRVMGGSGWEVSGFSGSFEVNAATAELARLVILSDPLQPDTGTCYLKTTLDYHFMLIGDGEFLIPRRSEYETFATDASQTDSTTVFSACHEYTVESSIRFDDPDASAESVNKASKVAAALPAGSSLTLALIGGIDMRSSAAGDAVSARVTEAVRAPRSKEILVSAGAIARGRILQLRHQYRTSQFLISIRFDTLEIQGVLSPLSVRLDRDLKTERPHSEHGLQTRPTEFSLPPPVSMDTGNSFAFPAESSTLAMPSGFQSKWITVVP